jgi:hypothetical protein
MKAPVYLMHAGTILVVVASSRVEPAPSHKLQFAKLHEDYISNVRRIMREHRHVGPSALVIGGGLQTYFPTHEGAPLYALRELLPLGASRGVDQEFQLETMAIRWSFALNLLPAALTADPVVAEALERNVELALRLLMQAHGIPDDFIPGDETLIPGDRTAVSIVVEIGQAGGRQFVEIPSSF